MWNNFDLDFRDGYEGEKLIEEILTGGKRVEVKRDFTFLKTGNVFIETHQYGKPSGISITEADYWAFVLGTVRIFVLTSELREIIKHGEVKRGVGDNNAFDGVLIKAYRLISCPRGTN